jgi:hypothetical protein
MKLHHKGFLLVTLAHRALLWDTALIGQAMSEYQLQGRYWINHFRLVLDELAAAGLIKREAHRLDAQSGRLEFQYSLTAFGRQRMQDTGLM